MNLDNIRDSIWRPVHILARASAMRSLEKVVHRPVLRSVLFSVRDYISNNVVLVWWNSAIRKQYESN
jgi:hypothetical protein